MSLVKWLLSAILVAAAGVGAAHVIALLDPLAAENAAGGPEGPAGEAKAPDGDIETDLIMDEIADLVALAKAPEPAPTFFEVPIEAEPEWNPGLAPLLDAAAACAPGDYDRTHSFGPGDSLEELWDGRGGPSAHLVDPAEAGNRRAQFNLGFSIASWGQPEEVDEAFEWIRRSAEAGYAPAITEVGAAYVYEFLGRERDLERARPWLEAGAEAGDPLSMFTLSRLPPAEGQPVEAYAVRRLRLELESALCHRDAALALADRLENGRGLPVRPNLARRLRADAAWR